MRGISLRNIADEAFVFIFSRNQEKPKPLSGCQLAPWLYIRYNLCPCARPAHVGKCMSMLFGSYVIFLLREVERTMTDRKIEQSDRRGFGQHSNRSIENFISHGEKKCLSRPEIYKIK